MTHEERLKMLEKEHQKKMAQLEADHQEKMTQINQRADEANVIINKLNSEINNANTIEELPKAEDLASAFKQIMSIMKEMR